MPLIEDDIYGELSFSARRPGVAKVYDQKGLVLLCSSFTKDISPSFRVGWIAPGRYLARVAQLKMATNIATSVLPQLAIASFLESGGYDRHLRTIRRAYAQKVTQMAQAVLHYFPAGTRVTSPAGGFVIWVQMPEEVDSLVLYQRALAAGITLAPGYIFSASPKYRNFIRLNAAYMNFAGERALARLGEMAGRDVKNSTKTELPPASCALWWIFFIREAYFTLSSATTGTGWSVISIQPRPFVRRCARRL